MSTPTGGLPELHKLHLQLEQVRKELKRGPRQIQTRRQKVERFEQQIAEQREQVKQLKMLADQKSLQLKTNEAKIADLKGKLNAATTNKEFDIIKSQIDADSMANSVLEDEILEVYEKVDEMQAEIAETEQQRDLAKTDENRVKADVEAEVPGLRSQADHLEQSLATAEKILPSAVLTVYRRLVSAHGASALAPVDGTACGACFAALSANVRVELNMGKYIFCSSCGRLLYKGND